MLEKIDKRATEICAVELTLVISAITASIWYTYVTFKGVFNPFYTVIIWLAESQENGKWDFPKDFTEFQAMWDKTNKASEFFAIQPFAAGFLLFIIGAGTLYFCILASQEIVPFLTRNYIKTRFGSEYYSDYIIKKKNDAIKINREISMHRKKYVTEQEQLLESLKKAEREHYEQWKKYNKSELTLSEWKSRVLIDKEDQRG